MLSEEQVKKIKEERHYRKAETFDTCAACRHLHSVSPSIHRCSLISTEMNRRFAIHSKFVCDQFERLGT